MAVRDLGIVTAYGYAVAGGYTGTEQEFTALLGDLALTVEDLENMTVSVTTLEPTEQATASYSDGVLSLGIPRGRNGEVTQDDLDEQLENYATNEDLYGAFPTGTASGSVASFNDGADNVPVKSCELQINPQQDLNGYDRPWPAGGSVNMLNTATQESGYINASGEVVTDGGISQHSALIPVTVGNQYTFSGVSSGTGNKRVHGYNSNGVWVQQLDFAYTESAGDAYSVTVTIPSGISYIKVSYMDLDKRKQVESGATVTEYRPYANICPINGWQDIDIYDDPTYGGTVKFNQLLQDTNFGGGIPSSMTRTYDSSTDTLSVSATIPSGGYGYVGKYFESVAGHYYAISFRASATNITSIWAKASADTSYTPSATYTGEKVYTVIQQVTEAGLNALLGFSAPSGTRVTISFSKANIIDLTEMFGAGNEPQTAEQLRDILPLDYYAYNAGTKTNVSAVNGTPYLVTTVQLGQTVYGGVVNPSTGELTINMAYVSSADCTVGLYDGATARISLVLPNSAPRLKPYAASVEPNILATNLKTTNKNRVTNADYQISQSDATNNQAMLLHINSSVNTIPLARDWVANNPFSVAYEIATPTTVQLTPAEVRTLLGDNNVWGDAGDIAVEYRADTKLYIDNKFNELQALVLENL